VVLKEPKGGDSVKKLVIREVETVKATSAAMYGGAWWCPWPD
jgi:hypothetical protein